MPAEIDELSVLLVAEGERLAPALHERLEKHGLNVQDCSRASLAQTAFVVAPDLIVLAGAAAEDGGVDVLASLASRPGTATLPVVLIGDPGGLGERASSFQHGIVAIIERTASADELARQISDVAHELPERTGEASGAVDAAGVQELIGLLTESLRTGILSLTGPDGASARVVLRADRPASEVIGQVVEQLRPLAGAQSGVRFEFHESTTGRLGALDLGDDDETAVLSELSRARLLLIEQNPARADLLAQGLRAHGARVAVADGLGHGLELARELTPDVVIVDGEAVEGWALGALRRIRRDPWLRWASLMLVDASQLWRDERRPDVQMLAKSIEALVRPDRELARRIQRDKFVGTRLDVLGPVRTLRVLAESKLGLRMRVQHARVVVDVDVSEGIIAGASAREPNAKADVVEGPVALATLLGVSQARVQIERAEAPRRMNIMSAVDDAIAVAAREEPVVPRSEPPPSIVPPASATPDDGAPPPEPLPRRDASDVARLVSHLEQLLRELREHTDPARALPPEAREDAPVPMPKLPTRPKSATPTGASGAADDWPGKPTTSPEGLEVPAGLRRRVRTSSQQLRGASEPGTGPTPAAAAAPPVPVHRAKPRHKTLVGMPIDPRPLPPPTPKTAPAAPKAAAPTPAPTPSPTPQVAAPDAFELEVTQLDIVAPPAEEGQAPVRFATAGPTPSPPEHEPEPARPPAAPAVERSPVPPAPPAAAQLAPPAAAQLAPPADVQLAGPPKPHARSKLPLVLAVTAAGVVVIVGAVFLVRALVADHGTQESIAGGEPRISPPAGSPTSQPEARANATQRQQARRVTGAPLGPSGALLEGRESDFDLARFGIAPIARPGSRRTRTRLFTRLLRDANQARKQHRLDEAATIYGRVLGMDRTNGRATAGFALVEVDRGRPANAILWAQRLVRLRPETASNWVLLGDAFRLGNDRDRARQAYARAVETEPRYAPAQRRLRELPGP